MRDWKVVVEVFPDQASDHFSLCSCAAAAFYVRCRSGEQAVQIAERELALNGWSVAATLSRERITASTNVRRSLHRGDYVCNLQRVNRRIFALHTDTSLPQDQIGMMYAEFLKGIRGGGYLLCNDGDRPYDPLLLGEQPIFPVWLNDEEPQRWREHWSLERRVQRLDAKALGSIIAQVHDDALLALGLTPTMLVTFHPRAIIAHL